MIQRIQSLYFLAVSVLTALMFLFPFMTALQGNAICEYNYNGFQIGAKLLAPVFVLSGIIVVSFLVSLISIFFYKKRMLQIRMSIFNIILFVFIYIVEIVYFFMLKGDLNLSNISVQISSVFPAINIVLTYLAIRSIGADEALIRSLNRLR